MKSYLKYSVVFVLIGLFVFGGVCLAANQAKKEAKPTLGLITYPYPIQWINAFNAGFTWYCQDHAIPHMIMKGEEFTAAAQINAARTMLNSGVDGIILVPVNEAAGDKICEIAKKENVPIMTSNTDVDNPYILMKIGFSNIKAGKICGQKIVEHLKNEVEPIGKAKGSVLELWYGTKNLESRQRSGGFHDVVDEYPGITVHDRIIERGTETLALQATQSAFTGREFDAIFAINSGSGAGAAMALQSMDYDPDDVFLAHFDAGKANLSMIKEGWSDVAVDQPPIFYNAIAAKYLVDYLKEGKGALPKPGTEVTAEDLDITGAKHLGVNPWTHPRWSPAKVELSTKAFPKEYKYDHLLFMPEPTIVDESNVDAPYLWSKLKY